MKQKFIVTQYKNYMVTALYEENAILELDCEPLGEQSILGNIYVGRVRDIVKNINAAFVEIEKGVVCYYSLYENTRHLFTKKPMGSKLQQGDEIIVQIAKDPLKTKPATGTSHLNIQGEYAALVVDNGKSGVSSHIKEPKRSQLKQLACSFETDAYSFIIRTNAKNVDEHIVLQELEKLSKRYEELLQYAVHRTLYSVLYRNDALYLQKLRGLYTDCVEEIITDIPEYHTAMKKLLDDTQSSLAPCLKFYEDVRYPLEKLYSLEKEFKQALGKRVWLKSGAYLIIEHTEAMHIIDVNTGKFTGKKKSEEVYLKINLEAAREVARQIRLRNLSGMILVDFIDMREETHVQQLVSVLHEALSKDPIGANYVDITKLGIIEITRKKQRKPLFEIVQSDIKCIE